MSLIPGVCLSLSGQGVYESRFFFKYEWFNVFCWAIRREEIPRKKINVILYNEKRWGNNDIIFLTF